MSRDGSGVYTPPLNSWNPPINSAQALPADWKAILDDLTTALTTSVAADGQTPITGILNLQNNRLSNVGAPIGQGDALRFDQMRKGANIASAATITIPIEGNLFEVSGTTGITTIADTFPGRAVWLYFQDAVTLTHSINLKLPNDEDVTTKAGDVLLMLNTDTSVWQCASFLRLTEDGLATKVNKSGDTMTGPLQITDGTKTARLQSDGNVIGSVFATGNLHDDLAAKLDLSGGQMTGSLLLKEGTVALPGLSFANDGSSDTGLWHISDGVFGITCNGAEQVRFGGDGAKFASRPQFAGKIPWDSGNLALAVISAAGGDVSDLSTGQSVRLSATFQATSTRLLAVCNATISNGTGQANDFYLTLRLWDNTSGSTALDSNDAISAAGTPLSYAGKLGASLSHNSLTIGHVYILQIILRKGNNVGPCYPNFMRIDGIQL